MAVSMHAHQEYDLHMSKKVRKTLTLDPEIVDALGDDADTLSATVNEILLVEVERRQRREALRSMLDRLAEERGPVDPAEVDEFRRLLS